MEFVTQEGTKAKVVHAMGLDAPHVLDVLDRAQFASDEEYLDFATKMTLERQSPEFAETRRRLKRELEERREKQIREENAAEYARIRSNVKLDGLDTKNIDTEAAELARRDLAAGRISASIMGATIEKYAKQLTEKRLDDRARNQMMNQFFRGSR